MLDFDNTHSKWLDRISRSKEQWNGNIIVNVMYSDKQFLARGYVNTKGFAHFGNLKVYDVYFWVSIEEYENLITAPSQGSYYWHNWSVYGTPQERYLGQDVGNRLDGEKDTFKSGDIKPGLFDNEAKLPTLANIDGKVLQQAKAEQENGTYDEWAESNFGNDQDTLDSIKAWLDRAELFEDLFERTNRIRALLQAEQLTTKQMMKTIMLDIQEMFGVSLNKKFMFSQLSKITDGKLNPGKWVKYRYEIKNIYDALEKDGVKGLTKTGKRIVSAKNPLIRDRAAFKGKEVVKGALRKKGRWLEGIEANQAIEKFHKKVLKESAQGFKKANSMKLETTILKDGTRAVRWKKDVKLGRRIITAAKKVLRIAKWFII